MNAGRGTVGFKPLPEPRKETTSKEMPTPQDQKMSAAPGNIYFFHSDHLGTGSFLTDASGHAYQFFANLPFGETMIEQHSSTEDYENRWKFNGKELDTETGLYYYGARYYDPSVSIWMSVDPLADIAPDRTPYHFVSNNPINRIDPLGLTDFALNKKTGEVSQVGEANDEPDRILKTNRKGEVKYNRKGEAKVAIDDIEQGILADGQNFKDESNLISVGGEGQPSETGVESFALKLSGYIGKEIGGTYFSKDGADNTTHIGIGNYKNNSHKESKSNGVGALRGAVSTMEEYNRFSITGFFHTHPGNGRDISNSDRLVPSNPDIKLRDNALKINPNLRFFLLTLPVNYGGKFPNKIDYTTGYSRRY